MRPSSDSPCPPRRPWRASLRPRGLAALRHLANQTVPEHLPWEVVVDNASPDDSVDVALHQWPAFGSPGPLRIGAVGGIGRAVAETELPRWFAGHGRYYAVGPQGEASGDVELSDLMRLAGYGLWFDDRLEFCHFMPPGRLRWTYFLGLV